MQLSSVGKFLRVAFISSLLLLPLSAKTLVTVDGYAISDSILNELKKQNPNFTFDSLPEQQKQQLLNGIVDQVLAANAAKKAGIDKSEEYKMIEMGVLGKLWVDKELQAMDSKTQISDEEAKKFYEDNKQHFITQKADLNHILVKTEGEAKSIIGELAKTPKAKIKSKFEDLAKKMSEDKGSATNGGRLEGINIFDLVPEFTQGVKALKAGTYTKDPVKTNYGFHVIYLTKLDPETTESFEKTKDQIKQSLKQQKQQQILQDKLKVMRDGAKITYGN